MAKNKQADDLFDHLRARGVRKKVAKAIADGASAKNGKRAEALAQTRARRPAVGQRRDP